jgi:hypothetical protein
MSARSAFFGLVAAALLAPCVAVAADEKPVAGSLTPTTTPAPPIGVLNSSDQLPRQQRVKSGAPVRRLSPSEIYARDHARPAPSFATVRPQMRKPLPGEGPDEVNDAKVASATAAGAPAKAPKRSRQLASRPALDGFLSDNQSAETHALEKPAGDRKSAKKKVAKKAATSATATAAAVPPPAPAPELIVRPPTPAAIYEHAAAQYRDLRRRDLEMVRHLLPPQQYAAKLAAIEAAYHPQDSFRSDRRDR